MMPVTLIFEDSGRRFKVATGLTAAQKFAGREFPDTEANFRAKTMALARKLMAIDEHLLATEGEPWEETRAFVKGVCGSGEARPTLLYRLMEERFVPTRKAEGTKALYRTTARKLRAYDEGATLSSVTRKWIEGFEAWLERNGNRTVNGRAIHLRNLKAVMLWAYDEGLVKELPFRKVKIRTEAAEIRNVTLGQLRALRDCDVEPCRRIYRDLFMLSFYLCGMNPADMLFLTEENVRDGWIVYRRRKTHRLYEVPLPEEARRIIERYRGERWLLRVMDEERDYCKFVSKWDKHLKVLGPMGVVTDALGRKRRRMGAPVLPENVRVYSARYTFASIGAELEIPRETIALCLGHSWADVTSRYIAYGRRRVEDAVKRIVEYVNADLKE